MYPEYKKLRQMTSKKLTPTPADIEGPFYKAGAPTKTSLDANPNLCLNGKVYNVDGKVIVGCTLDFWQADAVGSYDMNGFSYRGKTQTDGDGCYKMETIVPGDYQIGPNEYRCSHIHVKLSATGYKDLTTQLYFQDDKYDATDEWFNPQMVIGKPDGLFNFVLEKS